MDNRIIEGLVVGSPLSGQTPYSPWVDSSTDDPLYKKFVSNQLFFRAIPSVEGFIEQTRSRFPSNTHLDYEMLVDRDILSQFMTTAEYSKVRTIEANFIKASLDATTGPACAVPVVALFKFINAAFFELDQYQNREYILRALTAAANLYSGVGEPIDSTTEVNDAVVLAFIEAYYCSFYEAAPRSWTDRVCDSLQAALLPYRKPEHLPDSCMSKVASAFTLGFCAPLQNPHLGSMFAAQVKHGIGITTQFMDADLVRLIAA